MKKIFFLIFSIALISISYIPANAEEKTIDMTFETPVRFPSEISEEGKIFDKTCVEKCLLVSKNNKFVNATYLSEVLAFLFAYTTDKFYSISKWNDLKINEIVIKNDPDTTTMEIDFNAYVGRSPTDNQILLKDLFYINTTMNDLYSKIPNLINEKLKQQATGYKYAPMSIIITKEKIIINMGVILTDKPQVPEDSGKKIEVKAI